jgi:hypothetical protein
MGQIKDIAKRSQQWVNNIAVNVEKAIMSVDNQIIDINREQMLLSRDSNDNALIHQSTGSILLTPAYAKAQNKSKPDLFLSGEFQKNMFLDVNFPKYLIGSDDEKTNILQDDYGKAIFGIPKKDQSEAKGLTNKAIGRSYKRAVFR